MDKTQEELNKASHVLLDAEVRLNTVTIQIQDLERQIALLTSIEAHLKENIGVLQRKRVIIVASEYRKAITDLSTARTRLAFLRIDRENCLKIQGHSEFVYEKAKSEYEHAFKMLHEPMNNVIQGNFGRTDGQE